MTRRQAIARECTRALEQHPELDREAPETLTLVIRFHRPSGTPLRVLVRPESAYECQDIRDAGLT